MDNFSGCIPVGGSDRRTSVRPFLLRRDRALTRRTACKARPRAALSGGLRRYGSDKLRKARGSATAFRELRAIFLDDTLTSQPPALIGGRPSNVGTVIPSEPTDYRPASLESPASRRARRPNGNENGGNALWGRGDCPPNWLRAYSPRLTHPAGGYAQLTFDNWQPWPAASRPALSKPLGERRLGSRAPLFHLSPRLKPIIPGLLRDPGRS